MIKIILFILIFITNRAFADLSSEMNDFWDNLGGDLNSNSAYIGQSTGYYTGGSINTRTPVIQQRPVNIQMPKITAGCGGIDMFTGSFSHINLDQFVAQMKAIGANAVGYAFQIGLETLSPMIASTMSQLQEVVDTINGFNINSCESAKLLVDGIVGSAITAKESMCAQMSLITGSASDADAAKARCKSKTAQNQENEKLNDVEKITNINFTWQALKDDGYVLALGNETSEAFMSMVGTIIYKDNDTNPEFVEPNIIDNNFTNSLINGGSIKIKKCDETIRCLNLSDKEIIISDDVAYNQRVKTLLSDIQTKLINESNGTESELTDEEKALITQTSIPLLRIMVNTITNKSQIDIDILSNLVSRKLINDFFYNISTSLKQKIKSLGLKNNSKNPIKMLDDNINTVLSYLETERNKINDDFEQIQKIIEINKKIDEELASEYSSHIKDVLDYSNSI